MKYLVIKSSVFIELVSRQGSQAIRTTKKKPFNYHLMTKIFLEPKSPRKFGQVVSNFPVPEYAEI